MKVMYHSEAIWMIKKKVLYKAAALLFRMASSYLVLSSFFKKSYSKNIENGRDEGISILASNPNLCNICAASVYV